MYQRCEYGSTKVVVGQSVNMVGQTCGCGETLVQTWWDKAVKRKCKLYFRFTSYLASRNKLLPILKSYAGEGTHYLSSMERMLTGIQCVCVCVCCVVCVCV